MTAGPRTAVVAVGGDALTLPDQRGSAEEIAVNAAGMAAALAGLVRAGYRVAVVHGNGPQVGTLALQQDALAATVPPQPLHQLSAMTQAQLGGVLARAIDAACGGPGAAACLVTHVAAPPLPPGPAPPPRPGVRRPHKADRPVPRPPGGRAARRRAGLAVGRGRR